MLNKHGFVRSRFGNHFAKNNKKISILIDENVLGIYRYLASLNVDLVKIGDPNAPPLGSDDATVANYAKQNQHTIVTNDEKLVKQCEFLGVPNISTGIEDLAKKVKNYLEKS